MALVLHDEGFKVVATNHDFLQSTPPHEGIDCICTNPLGGRLACKFIAHAIALVPVAAMLLRVDFDSGKTRTHLFRDCESFAAKIVLLDRIMWFEGDVGPSSNHAWMVWDQRHRGAPTMSYAGRQE
jgi:hypothetical protein